MGALEDIAAERRRQVEAEGWTPEHDDTHGRCELATAAACYALAPSPVGIEREWAYPDPPQNWPWHRTWWKPRFYRQNLVKAGALILAEIERWDRLGVMHDVSVPCLAPKEDATGQGGPAAWAYEASYLVGQPWFLKLSLERPTESEWVRNIRPLYEAAPRPAGDMAGVAAPTSNDEAGIKPASPPSTPNDE